LAELEGLIARHETLQRQLQRHAREQERRDRLSGEEAAGDRSVSQDGAQEGAASSALVREDSFGRAESDAEGRVMEFGPESRRLRDKQGRLVSLHGAERKEMAANRQALESKNGTGSVEGEGSERRGEGDLMGSRAQAIGELSERLQESEEQRSMQTTRLAQLEGELATCQQQREKLEARLAQTLSAEKPRSGSSEKRIENTGERGFETARTWGLETETARGARAWFNPVFAEDGLAPTEKLEAGLGSEGSEDMGTQTGILAVVGDRDKLLRQNGRLVMEVS
jgi:phage shock protein A